uniref:DUF2790 domain-containing protein n=1 Tax=Ascaris lumbricoides TaxID=6252 RepID=A0A0M3I403_ASCLU
MMTASWYDVRGALHSSQYDAAVREVRINRCEHDQQHAVHMQRDGSHTYTPMYTSRTHH